jgi:hypothetical protein
MLMTRACELLILEIAVKSCVGAGQLGRSTIEVSGVVWRGVMWCSVV